MICDEGVCKAFFIRSTDQNNLRGISYAECGSYEKYADTEAAKKICSGKQTGFLVVLADKLISMKDGVDFYKSAKARFE